MTADTEALQRPPLKHPDASSDSMQDVMQGMLKYIASGDAKDLGKLGEYLGLVPETDSNELGLGAASGSKKLAPAAATTLLQKPKNPVFKLPVSYIPKYDQHPLSPARAIGLSPVALPAALVAPSGGR